MGCLHADWNLFLILGFFVRNPLPGEDFSSVMTVIQSESIVMFYLFLILYEFNGEIEIKSKADPHWTEERRKGI